MCERGFACFTRVNVGLRVLRVLRVRMWLCACFACENVALRMFCVYVLDGFACEIAFLRVNVALHGLRVLRV